LAHIPQGYTSFRARPRTFQQASSRLHHIEKENAAKSARGVFFFADKCNGGQGLRALTCAYSDVYSAALPGKKGGGCLSDQAGDYGRAVIETKLARHFPFQTPSSPAHIPDNARIT